jgi:tetratricopeptide (TPR) repeat protein
MEIKGFSLADKQRAVVMKVSGRIGVSVLVALLTICICYGEAWGPLDKNEDEIHYDKGESYLEKGQRDKAIAEFNKAIELNSEYFEAYWARGVVYARKGQYDKAISDFTKAIEIRPWDAYIYFIRGTAYSRKGQYDKAISDFTKAIELDREDAKSYYNRGVNYYYKKEYDKAWEDVHKAQSLGLQIPPESLKALREASGRQE